ncbi:MAG: gliding motility-associated C-terminal domain-containing protein [Bacteroidetes bacterium]|nr:gliding motility-associated C-terminal domain-containing protein [Bacteroidota bacterium]
MSEHINRRQNETLLFYHLVFPVKYRNSVTNEDCPTCELYVPSAFSPNNDGVNDVMAPLGKCIYNNLSFKIFNRWSELVFETNSTQNGWNGFYNSTEQPVDTYLWVLEYTDSKNKKYYQKGMFSLLR